MKITRFEDIEGWKKSRVLAQCVSRETHGRGWNRDPALVRQMRKCPTSAMANIAEGFDAGTDAEFIRFLKIAFRSLSELQSHLYVALDEGFLHQAAFDHLYQQAKEGKAVIGGFMRYLKRQ
jgi:four helix bundle protein